MKNQFLIRMEEPEDCQIVTDMGGVYYRLFMRPVTSRQKNEMDCMQFHEPASGRMVGYHEHNLGNETFFISQGKFLANCMGRGFLMEPGDILHIQPWMGHSFKPLEPESRLNIMFMEIDQQWAKTTPRMRIQENFPGLFESEGYRARARGAGDSPGIRTQPIQDEFPKDQVPQLRADGYGIRDHEYDGIKLQLKIAKYETDGVKEVWDLLMKPGFFCEWDDFFPEWRVFYVRSGKLRCWVKTGVDETLEFDAVAENIISIPPQTPFGFKVIEGGSVYDMDCGARLQDLCEELDTRFVNTPELKSDKPAILDLCKTFGLNITDIGYKG